MDEYRPSTGNLRLPFSEEKSKDFIVFLYWEFSLNILGEFEISLPPLRCTQQVHLKRRHEFTKLHGVTFHKTETIIRSVDVWWYVQ
jgi:hypothetical protein